MSLFVIYWCPSNQASSIAFKRSVFLFSDVFNKGKTAKLIVSIAIEHNNEKEYNKKKITIRDSVAEREI